MALTRDTVMAALRLVNDPELHEDLVSLNMVKDVTIDGDNVRVVVELTTPACPLKERIEADVTNALTGIGARYVTVDMTARTRGPAGPRPSGLPQVKNIVAIGAGKGGVGKSTIALNVAIGLQRTGAKVGLMDADVYGPSMPTMLGLRGVPHQVRGGNRIVPHFVHGIHAITIGSVVEADKPLIWRGPMAQNAFKQLMVDNADWPELDYLIVDLPPGTGDVPLTLCQMLPLTGAVVVAQPSQVALDDAIRAVGMFQQLGTPVLGIVENMSYLILPDGTKHDIFGYGGAEQEAQKLGLPFLGGVPIFPELRQNCDAGTPHKNFEGNLVLAESLKKIVENLAAQISIRNMEQSTPELNVI